MDVRFLAGRSVLDETLLGSAASRVVGCAMISLVVATGLVSAWLLVRRVTGAIQQPLHPGGLVLLTLALIAVCSAVRLAPPIATRQARWRWIRLASVAVIDVCAVVVATALSLPGTSPVALSLLWCSLVVTLIVLWSITVVRRARGQQDSGSPPPTATGVTGQQRAEASLPSEVSQQMTRSVDWQGRDTFQGLFRVCFRPDERTQSVHIVFCPPFANRPATQVRQRSGPQVSIKPAEVQTYGMRLELRLPAPVDQPVAVTLEASACEELDTPPVDVATPSSPGSADAE
jgi:hypothetical protein